MTKLMMKLRASGYTRSQRWEILKSGSRRYRRMVEEEDRGIRRVNRPRWEDGRVRFVKKVLLKKNWFKKKGGNKRESRRDIEGNRGGVKSKEERREIRDSEELEPETVMFIPSTPRGELL